MLIYALGYAIASPLLPMRFRPTQIEAARITQLVQAAPRNGGCCGSIHETARSRGFAARSFRGIARRADWQTGRVLTTFDWRDRCPVARSRACSTRYTRGSEFHFS